MNRNPNAEMPTRRAVGAGLVGLGLGATLGLPSPAAAQSQSFTWVTPFGMIVAYAPELIAKAGGYWEKLGLDGTIFGAPGGAMALQQLLSGQALVSRAPGIDLIKNVVREKAPFVAIATLDQGSPFYVISKIGQEIRNPADMVGKTIGLISRGSASDNLAELMLSQAGIARDKVNFQVVGASAGAFGLIEQGRINAFITSAGALVTLKQSGAPVYAFNTDDYGAIPGQAYIVARSTLEKQPETLVKILKGIRQAIDFIVNDTGLNKTAALLKQFDVAEMANPEIAKAALVYEKRLWDLNGAQNRLRNDPAGWQTAREIMAKANLIPADSTTAVFTNEIYDRAIAG